MQRTTHQKLSTVIGLTLCFASTLTVAASLEDVEAAIKSGKTTFNLRYRYENVDQDNINEDADASTLRTRMTWQSGQLDKFSIGVEMDYVSVIGSERYNSTQNGHTSYPVVADPRGFDLNLSYLKYANDNLTSTLGRQRVLHGSQRFVGGVGWRQNEQTYDAWRFQYKNTAPVTVDYAYVWNVNRIFGPDDGAQPSDWHGSSHLLTSKWQISDSHNLEMTAYLLDFDNDNGIANSTQTLGLNYLGQFKNLTVTAAAATQSDHGNNPLSYRADYFQFQADVRLTPVVLTLGYEQLGSDDSLAGFQTPLATLHKFQGWADKFLNTPAAGITDSYVGIRGNIHKVNLVAMWHEFNPSDGGGDYGSELNLMANWSFHKNASIQLKYAQYNEDGFSVDTTKLWTTFILKL